MGALKDGPARFVIKGLTRKSESYEEAIKCLKEQDDCPRFIQEEHTCSIVDVASVTNRSAMELHPHYDAVTQHYDAVTEHYQAIKAAKADF